MAEGHVEGDFRAPLPRTDRRAIGARVPCIVLGLCCVASSLLAQMPVPVPVRVEAVRSERVQQRQPVLGELRAVHRSRVSGKEAGSILSLPVREGQALHKGDLLCQLDGKRLQLELAAQQARASADQAALDQRRLQAEQASRDARTLQRLSSEGAANPRELADAETRAAVAAAAVSGAEQQLELDQAQVALLRQRLDDLSVTAPFDGSVVRRLADTGQWLAVGSPVVELISTRVEAWLDVPQRLAGALATEDGPLEVELDAGGEHLFVEHPRVVGEVDPAGRSFSLVAELPPGPGHLPGMSLRAWVPSGPRADRLTVSADAVLRGETGSFVFVARPTAEEQAPRAVPVAVEWLFSLGARAVLAAPDLSVGELVVVEGNERLLPGQPLAPLGAVEDDGQPAGRSAGS